jgi:signal transduction histidine kinase
MKLKRIIYFLSLLLLALLSSCDKSELINESDKAWLKQHPNLTVGISPNAPPYQFVNDNGELCGIFIDFWTIIEKRLGYKFKKVYDSDFSKLLSGVKNGNIDVLLEIQKTDERATFLNFTPTLLSHSHVIVTRKSITNVSSIYDLKDKNVAVVNKYAIQEYLSTKYPTLKLTPYYDDIECLRAVSTGNADAFICQEAVATYYIESEGISNLKIAGGLDYQNQLSIACTKNYAELNSILTKAVNSINHEEKQEIYTKWLSFKVVPFYQQAKFWIYIALIVVLVLMIVTVFYFALQRKVLQKTRELVLAKERAEESDRLKSAFLANMSHEIRTPMNGILGFSSLLKEPGLTGEKQQEYIKVIEKSGHRMLNLINDIIDLSKIESGLMLVNRKEVNICEQIDNMYDLFNPEAELKGLHFVIKNKLSADEAVVITDPEKVESILSNLIKNAIKFTSQGSIELGCDRKGEELEFFVKDSGIGIPKERQEAVFERFIQADIADKMAWQGAGLGLSISKAYVEMLGGKIWLESLEDKETTFYFTLPYNAK